MQFIAYSDIVAKTLCVFLAIMLFASLYLFLIKGISLACRAVQARKFLKGLANARSWQQVQKLVDAQPTIESFSRLSHCIMIEKKKSEAGVSAYSQAQAQGAVARRLIEEEATQQAKELHQGLNMLTAIVWVAPITGLAATAWRAIWPWLQSNQPAWPQGFALIRFGMLVALASLLVYMGLLLANRIYLAKFDDFQRLILPMIEGSGGGVAAREVESRYGFTQAWQGVLRTDV